LFWTAARSLREKNDRPMWRRLKAALLAGKIPTTHGGVIGQAWRGRGPRAALLAAALVGIDILPLDEDLGKHAPVSYLPKRRNQT
jgi:hypothetical protein